MIEQALRGNKGSTSNEANLSSVISVVWIGDVHQLLPVFGHAVFSASKKKKSNDRHGQQLWRGANWKSRKSLAVLVYTTVWNGRATCRNCAAICRGKTNS